MSQIILHRSIIATLPRSGNQAGQRTLVMVRLDDAARGRRFVTHATKTAFPGRRQIDYLSGFDEDGGDYYSILGLDPGADKKTIKKAYHNAMRDCHPDSNHTEEAHEFATFLNEIHECLMDEERRADYDAMIGFSHLAVNPFQDTSFEADQIFVDEITCIGCTNCAGVCPKTFEMQWDDAGRARAVQQGVDNFDNLQEAIETCPVNCIHRVTAPQLTLLETVMRKIERVDVWIMNSGGQALDVFNEANLAWRKRHVMLRAREEAERQKTIWQMWEPAGGSTAGQMNSQASSGDSKHRRRASQTAEQAAKAARRWRDYQRRKNTKVALQLPAAH